MRAFVPGHHPAGDEPSTESITDEALAWLDGHGDERFFLWVHWFDPHLPYAPPADLAPRGDAPRRIGTSFDDPTSVRAGYLVPDRAERDWIEALYDAELRLVDREVGRFLDALRASPHWADTLVVFASDHGEELFEHGGFEHGHTVHEEVLRVPLAIRLPGTTTGQRVAGPTSLEDVPATIADLVGSDAAFAGRSLRPRWEEGAPADEVFCATGTFYYTDRAAVIRGGLKYVLDLETGEERLYDLATDPGETRSLAREREADVEAARRWLREHEAAARAERERLGIVDDEVEVDSSVLRALEKVGYLGGD